MEKSYCCLCSRDQLFPLAIWPKMGRFPARTWRRRTANGGKCYFVLPFIKVKLRIHKPSTISAGKSGKNWMWPLGHKSAVSISQVATSLLLLNKTIFLVILDGNMMRIPPVKMHFAPKKRKSRWMKLKTNSNVAAQFELSQKATSCAKREGACNPMTARPHKRAPLNHA